MADDGPAVQRPYSRGGLASRGLILPQDAFQATLLVAVRVRPLLPGEVKEKHKDILQVIDNKLVLVKDPDETKDYLDIVQGRTKEKRYTFDLAFGAGSTARELHAAVCRELVAGVVRGLNGTVLAYGATSSGKTHTMVGTPQDPGLMVLSLQQIFDELAQERDDLPPEVVCSYLEVYNEYIYDLLDPSSGHLDLREDAQGGCQAAGLRHVVVSSAPEIMKLLVEGNSRRKTEATDANAVSSRSHALLEVSVRRRPHNHHRAQVITGKLSLVDLAGSERASDTNNVGHKLRDGANINRSLLALANCINALGRLHKKGLQAYVPYRNSKLTRLLKDGLSGNSRTAMVACVSSSSEQYQNSINTLKYADRAKEIKTHIVANVGTVESHVADYERMIDELQAQVISLKAEVVAKPPPPHTTAGGGSSAGEEDLEGLDELSHQITENVQERINIQKALFELEDLNVQTRGDLDHLDGLLRDARAAGAPSDDVSDLAERRQEALDTIRENEEAGLRYRADIELNKQALAALEARIDAAIRSGTNRQYLRVLRLYRLAGVTNMELQFQVAVRDQVVSEQREVIASLWAIMDAAGLTREQIGTLAASHGILLAGDAAGVASHRRGGGSGGGEDDDAGWVAGALANSKMAPNKSIKGTRATNRAQFWQRYAGEQRAADAVGGSGTGESVAAAEPAMPRGAHRPLSAVGPAAAVSARRGVSARGPRDSSGGPSAAPASAAVAISGAGKHVRHVSLGSLVLSPPNGGILSPPRTSALSPVAGASASRAPPPADGDSTDAASLRAELARVKAQLRALTLGDAAAAAVPAGQGVDAEAARRADVARALRTIREQRPRAGEEDGGSSTGDAGSRAAALQLLKQRNRQRDSEPV